LTIIFSRGIAWYVNDYIIPVIEVRRGTTYTFRINGGDDPENPSRYFPFYLTDSISGGFVQLKPEERKNETIFAGITVTNETDDGIYGYELDGVAPLCIYEYTDDTEATLNKTYDEYFATLNTTCAENDAIISKASVFEFTPDEDTPDTVYYQCATYRNLGWEIRVIDKDAPGTSAGSNTTSSANKNDVIKVLLSIWSIVTFLLSALGYN
jgi:hypothetical protein